MSNNKLFDSTLLSAPRTKIMGYIEEINTALDNIESIDITSCWSEFSNQESTPTSPSLKTKYEFLQSKTTNIKSALNSYIDFLTNAQNSYIELTNDMLEDVNTIINKE